jgi:nucleoside-diphosphate-sugar epimerase
LNEFGPGSVVCLVRPAATRSEAEALKRYEAAGLRLIWGDLLNNPVSTDPPPAAGIVFHLAANIDTEATETEARANDVGTANLLDWLRPVSRGARILYSSSVAVHDRDRHPTAPIREDSPHVPRTAYGRTKLRGEHILRDRSANDGYGWTVLRLPTVYGPGQKAGGLFDKMMRWVGNGSLAGRIDWPGRTSIVHVDDAADVMVEFATSVGRAGEVYCVASDESLTVGELARKIGSAIGKSVDPIRLPGPLLRAARILLWNRIVWAAMPRPARVTFWRLSLIVSDGFWFDTTKLRRVYRKPLRPIEEGLAELVGQVRL